MWDSKLEVGREGNTSFCIKIIIHFKYLEPSDYSFSSWSGEEEPQNDTVVTSKTGYGM